MAARFFLDRSFSNQNFRFLVKSSSKLLTHEASGMNSKLTIFLPYVPLQVALLKDEVNMILCTMGSLPKIPQLHDELVVALHDHPKPAQNFFPEIKFAIVDEAAQMAETFAPLLLSVGPSGKNHLEQILLVGDPKQLGPQIEGFSVVDHSMSIRRSLMERISTAAGSSPAASPRLLETQYRMFPLLGRLVSELFYEDRYGIFTQRPAFCPSSSPSPNS